jgi:hypothetical protein
MYLILGVGCVRAGVNFEQSQLLLDELNALTFLLILVVKKADLISQLKELRSGQIAASPVATSSELTLIIVIRCSIRGPSNLFLIC